MTGNLTNWKIITRFSDRSRVGEVYLNLSSHLRKGNNTSYRFPRERTTYDYKLLNLKKKIMIKISEYKMFVK